jgi:hypothetical protein
MRRSSIRSEKPNVEQVGRLWIGEPEVGHQDEPVRWLLIKYLDQVGLQVLEMPLCHALPAASLQLQ